MMNGCDTRYTADCAEYIHINGHDILAIGTYELQENTRVGDIVLYDVTDRKLQAGFNELCSGVFDLKWCGRRLLSAHANGTCAIRFLDDDLSLEHQTLVSIQEYAHDSPYCLTGRWDSLTEATFLSSLSNGHIFEYDLNMEKMTHYFQAHTYPGGDPAEVWIVAYCPDTDAAFCSGADDGILKVWDKRRGLETPVAQNSRTHEAGVCSLQFDPHQTFIFATGSYDHHVRIWDFRNLRQPVKAAYDTGAGIWRMRWHPTIRDTMVTACMRAGFQVLDWSGDEASASFVYNHGFELGRWESLAYGVDWITPPNKPSYIAGASFYDKTVRLLDWQASA